MTRPQSDDLLLQAWREAESNTVTACEALRVVERELAEAKSERDAYKARFHRLIAVAATGWSLAVSMFVLWISR